jgi:NADPH2:quinone reductase
MQYLEVNDTGQLYVATTERPEVGPGQCLIRVKAIGVNRADLLQKQGKYPPPAGESPILGLEVCGDIIELGAGVSQWQCQDKVYALVAGGGYAQYVVVDASHLMPLPEHLSYAQGAALAEVFLTAYQSLFTLAKLQPGEHLLVHAGASGVGTAAIQLAKDKGAEVCVTASSAEKLDACLALGADSAINYRQEDFVTTHKKRNDKAFDVVLDVVGGDYVNRNLKVMALDSRLVILAILGGRFCPELDIARMLQKRVTIMASTLRNRSIEYKAQLVKDFLRDFGDSLNNGAVKPVVAQTFNWQQAEVAHQQMAANQNIGKYILLVD